METRTVAQVGIAIGFSCRHSAKVSRKLGLHETVKHPLRERQEPAAVLMRVRAKLSARRGSLSGTTEVSGKGSYAVIASDKLYRLGGSIQD